MTVKACHSPCTLKVDGVVDQVVGQEAEFWVLYLRFHASQVCNI